MPTNTANKTEYLPPQLNSLPDVRAALVQSRDLLDSILTWNDLSATRREQLTAASNLIEKAWDRVDAALWEAK